MVFVAQDQPSKKGKEQVELDYSHHEPEVITGIPAQGKFGDGRGGGPGVGGDGRSAGPDVIDNRPDEIGYERLGETFLDELAIAEFVLAVVIEKDQPGYGDEQRYRISDQDQHKGRNPGGNIIKIRSMDKDRQRVLHGDGQESQPSEDIYFIKAMFLHLGHILSSGAVFLPAHSRRAWSLHLWIEPNHNNM